MTGVHIQEIVNRTEEIIKRTDIKEDHVPPVGWQLDLHHDVRDLAKMVQEIAISLYGK